MGTNATNEQREFARVYCQCFNVMETGRRFGYTRNTAYKIFHQDATQAMIHDEMERRATRTQLDMDAIIRQLALITKSDITDYFEDAGSGILTLKEFKQLPKEMTQAIQSVEEKIDAFGNVTIKLKLYDKLKAIQIVAQSLTAMIEQMRDFMNARQGEDNDFSIQDDKGSSIKVISAPGKVPTLAEWDTQVREAEEARKDDNVIDVTFEEVPNGT